MFHLGYFVRKNGGIQMLSRIPLKCCLLVLVLGFVACRGLPTLCPNNVYVNITHDAATRILQCSLGLVLALAVIRVTLTLPCEVFAKFGRHSLWIYIGHAIPCLILNRLYSKYDLTMNVLMAFCVALVITFAMGYIAIVYYRWRKLSVD